MLTDILTPAFADNFWLIFLALTVASFFHGTMGFGFPLIVTPILTLFMDIRSVVLLSLCPTIFINMVNMFHGGNTLENLRGFGFFPVFIIIGTIIGSVMLLILPAEPINLLLGLTTLLYLAVNYRFNLSRRSPIFHDNRIAFPLFGTLAGITAGATNVMLAVMMIYVIGIGAEKTRRIQIMNMSFMTGKIGQVGVFIFFGVFTFSYLAEAALSVLMCVPGLYIGFKTGDRINPKPYEWMMIISLVIISVILIVRSVSGYWF